MELKFSLRYSREKFEQIVKIPNKFTLEDLNFFLINSLNWDQIHAYSFHFKGEPFTTTKAEYGSPIHKVPNPAEYMFRALHLELNEKNFSSQKQIEKYLQRKILDGNISTKYPEIMDGGKVRLSDLALSIDQKFVYVYDWGDNWEFDVTILSLDDAKKPKVIKSIGRVPVQYENNEEQYSEDTYEIPEIDFQILKKRHNDYGKKAGWIEYGSQGFDITGKSKIDLRAYRTKIVGLNRLVLSYKSDNTWTIVDFEIDLVVDGLMNFSAVKGNLDRYLEQLKNKFQDIVRISTIEAQFLLSRAYHMSIERNKSLEETTMNWLKKFSIPSKKLKKSPFRCMLCERGELSREAMDLLRTTSKSISKLDKSDINMETSMLSCKSCISYLLKHM